MYQRSRLFSHKDCIATCPLFKPKRKSSPLKGNTYAEIFDVEWIWEEMQEKLPYKGKIYYLSSTDSKWVYHSHSNCLKKKTRFIFHMHISRGQLKVDNVVYNASKEVLPATCSKCYTIFLNENYQNSCDEGSPSFITTSIWDVSVIDEKTR